MGLEDAENNANPIYHQQLPYALLLMPYAYC